MSDNSGNNCEPLARLKQDEYEMQHFEFSSSEFLFYFRHSVETGLRNGFLTLSADLIQVINTADSERFKKYIEKLEEKSIHRALNCIEKTAEPHIGQMIAIPKNVLLPQDGMHKKQFTEEEVSQLEQEVRYYENELMKTFQQKQFLENEKETLKAVNPLINRTQEIINAQKRAIHVRQLVEKVGSSYENIRNMKIDLGINADDAIETHSSHFIAK